MDSFLLFVRVVLSLAAVLGLLWYLQRRVGRGQAGAEKLIHVVTRQGLGQKASMLIVDADGTRFTLGVTEQNVTILQTSTAPERVALPAADQPERLSNTLPGQPNLIAGSVFSADTWKKAAGSLGADPLAGSIFSAQTWKQAGQAMRGGFKS